jgi:hypothetical protein
MTKLKDADCIVSCASLWTASRKVADILKYTYVKNASRPQKVPIFFMCFFLHILNMTLQISMIKLTNKKLFVNVVY